VKFSSWRIGLLVLLLAFFCHLNWNSFNAPFERDEGQYAYGAWLMTQGKLPYIDQYEQKPPMIFYPYLIALAINPSAVWAPHLVAAISFFISIILVGLVAWREWGERAGWLAAFLTPTIIMLPRLAPFAANTEKFLLLPLLALLTIYVYFRTRPAAWFWAAFFAVMAVLYKQIALLIVFYILLVWFISLKNNKEKLACLGWSLAGAGLSFIIFTGYFFWRGAWPYFWESAIWYNKFYLQSTGGLTLQHFFSHVKYFWAVMPAVILLLGWGMIKRPPRWNFYLGLLGIGLVTVFTSPYGHYYIMLMPLLALLVAAATKEMRSWLVPGLVVLSVYWPASPIYFVSPNDLTGQVYGYLNPFVEAPIAGAKVRELTKADDYLFIAGTEQEILYYAKRLTPSQITGVYALMINSPKAAAYQQKVIADLERHPPEIILFVRSQLSWLRQPGSPPDIFRYLQKTLSRDYTMVGGTVRIGNEAFWQAPLKPESMAYCSIMLFRRK